MVGNAAQRKCKQNINVFKLSLILNAKHQYVEYVTHTFFERHHKSKTTKLQLPAVKRGHLGHIFLQ